MARLTLVTGTSTGIGRATALEVVGDALTARRPRTRYVVGGQAKAQTVAARVLPDRAFDVLVTRALSSTRR